MTFHETVSGLYPDKYNRKIREWLNVRYGNEEGERIWEQTKKNFVSFYEELPDYGGKKNGHAMAIYGGVLVFALYQSLPDQPPLEEIQDFIQNLFMEPFVKLGKIFNLNRRSHMRLIDKIFKKVGNRDKKDIQKYPEGFINVSIPYDSEHQISRYAFTQCPNAEFARKHNLLHVLPLLCNCDFFGIEQIHGQLIRCGTCGNSKQCDYCVVGDRNPLTKEYETVKDGKGFLVSRKIR